MNTLLCCLVSLVTLAVSSANSSDAQKETRFFEMRTYYAAPGKLDDLLARFRNHTMKLFEKHGMSNIGYWVPLTNSNSRRKLRTQRLP